jgi:hypothetical protein
VPLPPLRHQPKTLKRPTIQPNDSLFETIVPKKPLARFPQLDISDVRQPKQNQVNESFKSDNTDNSV